MTILLRSSSTLLTPEEAGRRAETLARTATTPKRSMETLLAHAGIGDSEDHNGLSDATAGSRTMNTPLAPPLHLATTYERPASGLYGPHDVEYTRLDNPTRLLLEREITRLETHGGFNLDVPEDADVHCTTNSGADESTSYSCAFASGMMAVSSLVLAHQAPLVVIVPVDLYHGVTTVLWDIWKRFHVSVVQVNVRDPEALSQVLVELDNKNNNPDALTTSTTATTPDCMVWLETPSNPQCHVIDIAATCQLIRRVRPANTTIVVDSTLAPPVTTQPLRLGADVCLHSATKFLAGHSDALCGVVTTSPWTERGRAMAHLMKEIQVEAGGVASAWDSWLVLRGLRTLAVRYQRQSSTALQFAQFLQQQQQDGEVGVTRVHYPGLTSHPDYEIAQRQMQNHMFGGVMSVELDSKCRAMAVAGALRTIRRATSLGGTETLIEHRASIEPPGRVTSPPGLLRISVGLEELHDLIADWAQAVTIAEQVMSGN